MVQLFGPGLVTLENKQIIAYGDQFIRGIGNAGSAHHHRVGIRGTNQFQRRKGTGGIGKPVGRNREFPAVSGVRCRFSSLQAELAKLDLVRKLGLPAEL